MNRFDWPRLTPWEVDGDQTLRQAISLVGDPVDAIQDLAMQKIASAPYQCGRRLVEALNNPHKRTRDGLFRLMAELELKGLDTFLYANDQIEACYRYLSQADALRKRRHDSPTRLLIDHLEEQGHERVETLLRVVALQDRSGQMRIVFRSLFSTDERQRANAMEALDDIVQPALLTIYLPLVNNSPISELIDIGRKRFKFPDFHKNLDVLYRDLFNQDNWVTVLLALHAAGNDVTATADSETIEYLATSENKHIRRKVSQIRQSQRESSRQKETGMEQELSIPEKILMLKKVDILKNMSVNELAAIASIANKVVYPAGKIIFREGDVADTMVLVISGGVAALKNETEKLGAFRAGDSIGAMVLISDDVRLFTGRTEQETRLLEIHKRDFLEIVREYPQISLEITKLLAGIVKELINKVANKSGTQEDRLFNGSLGIDRPIQ